MSVQLSPLVIHDVVPLVGTIGSPGQFQPIITFNGSDFSNLVRYESIRITNVAGDQPKRCTLTVNKTGTPPTAGMDVKIALQSVFPANLIFGGTITQVEQSFDKLLGNTVYQVTCTGYTFLLSERYPNVSYVNTSAGTIIANLLTLYGPPGFAATSISAGVTATLTTINFDGTQDLPHCISKLMSAIGGYWRIDDSKIVHAYLAAETDAVPDPIDVSNTTAMIDPAFKYKVDISQIRNRIKVKGGSGGSTSIPIGAGGASFIPISSALAFNLSGPGQALVDIPVAGTPGPMKTPTPVSYTQATQSSLVTSTIQYISPPSFVVQSTSVLSGGQLPSGSYFYGFTTLTLAGETTLGAFTSVLSGFNGARVQMNINMNALFPFRVNGAYAINVYRKPIANSFGQYQLVGSIQLGQSGLTSPFFDNVPDNSLGVFAPVFNSAAYSGTTAIVSSIGGLAVVCDPGTNVVSPGVMTYNGGAAFWYTASGNNLVVQAFSAGASFPTPGTVLRSSAALLGVTGLSTGAALPSGLSVSSFTQADDAASQAALAALLGNGDTGVREEFISDGSLVTDAMVKARAAAELAYFKNPIISFDYPTRDSKVGPGRSVHVNIAGLTGDFLIQQVDISRIGTDIGANIIQSPLYTVSASNVKFTLQDLLRQLGGLLTLSGSVIG